MKVLPLTEGEQNRLILENTGLVPCIAADFRGKKGIPFEDLVAEGMLGLVQAARTFTPIAKFGSFARQRIRGAIMDLIRRYEELDHLDGASDEDEDRIHQWQIWGAFPSEAWTSLTATPYQILEVCQEFSDNKEAVEAAFLSLRPRERKMVHAHFLRQPRIDLEQLARDHKVTYWTAVDIVFGAVEKMRDVINASRKYKSGVSRKGRLRHPASQGRSSHYAGRIAQETAGGPQFA
jgi:RNA polymerase sigma factor (sigma-70 family)